VNQREAIRAMRSQKSEGGRVFAATAPGAIDLAPRPGSALRSSVHCGHWFLSSDAASKEFSPLPTDCIRIS
jgi:hypothetical protein